MRVLSFLTQIEHAVIAESPDVEGGAWETGRMVNFHQGLARLTLAPRPAADLPLPGGTIFLQGFCLADGSVCFKASLAWQGSNAAPVIAVYSTPSTNWKLAASGIASAWLEGPPAVPATSTPAADLVPLAAAAG